MKTVFLFWKSSFSQILIDFINSFELIKINRVIDYSDFLAFLILPISIYVLENAKKFEIKIEHTKLKKVGVNILFIISAFTFFATSVDDNVPNIQTTAINIESCCDFEPINTDLGTGKIYIPTVFTPDENGVNDYFQPSVDSNILRIDTFIVMSSVTGDIVFEQFNLEEITPEFGFDGNVAGSTIATQYSYVITATSKDSITERFTGVVCCLPCTFPINASSPDSIGNCAFPVQFNSNEGYDENIDPGEVLDCFN